MWRAPLREPELAVDEVAARIDQLVDRSIYEDRPPRAEYRLTEKGRARSTVVTAIYDWGEQWAPSTDEVAASSA